MKMMPLGRIISPARKSLAPMFFMTTLCLTLTQTALAQMPWAPDYQTALRVAKETDRLVLLHFWNDGCPPCARMEAEVFSRQDVAQAIARDYVPVSIRSADAPSLIHQFEITGVPADVVLNADGQFLAKSSGGVDAQTYTTRWATVSQRYRQLLAEQRELQTALPDPNGSTTEYSTGLHPAPGATTGTSVGAPTPPFSTGSPTIPPEQPAALAQLNTEIDAGGMSTGIQGVDRPAQPVATSQERPPYDNGNAAPSSAHSPLPHALDGFCAVALNEQEQWIEGDPQWSTTFQGRSYIFSGPQALQRFQTSPERFAPAASGIDIVLHSQQAGSIPGERQYGVWCDNQIFLFSNPDTLRAFQENPSYYIEYMRRIENAASSTQDRSTM